MAKMIYSSFITNDAQMMIPDYDIKDVVGCTVRNLNMIEELGEIEYVFCDKTGTLTQNVLEFKALSFPL